MDVVFDADEFEDTPDHGLLSLTPATGDNEAAINMDVDDIHIRNDDSTQSSRAGCSTANAQSVCNRNPTCDHLQSH